MRLIYIALSLMLFSHTAYCYQVMDYWYESGSPTEQVGRIINGGVSFTNQVQTIKSSAVSPANTHEITSFMLQENDVDTSVLNSLSAYHIENTPRFDSLNITPEVLGALKIAPAPFRLTEGAYFCYRLSTEMDLIIEIYDRRGHLVGTKLITAGDPQGGSAGYNKVPINRAFFSMDLPAGVYFSILKYKGAVVKRSKFEVQP